MAACLLVVGGLLVVAAGRRLLVAGRPAAAVRLLVVAPRAAGCPRVGGRPLVVAGRLLAGLPAGRAAAVAAAGRPRVAAPRGPCFVSRAAPRLRRRRPAPAVVRAQRERAPCACAGINLGGNVARVKQRREFYNHLSLRVVVGVKSGRRARERCALLGEASLDGSRDA